MTIALSDSTKSTFYNMPKSVLRLPNASVHDKARNLTQQIRFTGMGANSMKKSHLEYFENLLRTQLRDLLAHGEHTIMGIRSQEQSMSDPLDRAAYDEDQSRLFRIRDRESRLIKKIKNALEAIADGSYGICESCSEEISYQRLQARPVTTKCITCKMREEEMEKAARMR